MERIMETFKDKTKFEVKKKKSERLFFGGWEGKMDLQAHKRMSTLLIIILSNEKQATH